MVDVRIKTRFRSEYKDAIKNVLKQCVKLCIKLDLIEGNTLFIDGSKFRANASINNTWTDKRCEARLEKISKNIDRLPARIGTGGQAQKETCPNSSGGPVLSFITPYLSKNKFHLTQSGERGNELMM